MCYPNAGMGVIARPRPTPNGLSSTRAFYGNMLRALAECASLLREAHASAVWPARAGAVQWTKVRRQFPPDVDPGPILERLACVLDPELDEPILKLGFVQSLRLRDGRVTVSLQLPTNWCAVNFAFAMAEDIRVALLMVDVIREVVVQLGEHCTAPQIEAAVNSGKSFDEAFPAEHHGGLFALRQTFLRKGFLFRQERLLRALRVAGLSASTISRLRVCDEASDAFTSTTAADCVRRYLARRAELDFDRSPTAPLIVDQNGAALPEDQLEAHYQRIRTVRVSMEANGSSAGRLWPRAAPHPHNRPRQQNREGE